MLPHIHIDGASLHKDFWIATHSCQIFLEQRQPFLVEHWKTFFLNPWCIAIQSRICLLWRAGWKWYFPSQMIAFTRASDLKFMASFPPALVTFVMDYSSVSAQKRLPHDIKQWLHSIWLLYIDPKYLPSDGKLDTTIISKIVSDFIKHSKASTKDCQNRKTTVRRESILY